MTPLQFEELYQRDWDELESALDAIGKRGPQLKNRSKELPSGERIAELYRRACEHLALARARA
jgi:hypothetical protein